MKRLTLDEAAEQLGISRGAAYKRVRRGTLAHTKGQDGRVYVYLDAGKNTEQDMGVKESRIGNQSNQRSWWDFVVGVSGALALIGAMTYVLGLFTLWVPIARIYTHDFVTAWHAASLAPRTIVAALGVRQLIAVPLLIIILIVASILWQPRLSWIGGWYADIIFRHLLPRGAYYRRAQETQDRMPLPPIIARVRPNYSMVVIQFLIQLLSGNKVSKRIFPIYMVVVIYAAWQILASSGHATILSVALMTLVIILFIGALAYFSDVIRTLWRFEHRSALGPGLGMILVLILCSVILFVASQARIIELSFSLVTNATIVLAAATLVSFTATSQALRLTENYVDSFRDMDEESQRKLHRQRLVSFGVLSASAFTAAFLLIAVAKPPLPTVVISGNTDMNGKLIAHTEGFWHVLNEDGGLVAIPDDEIKTVRVSSQGY